MWETCGKNLPCIYMHWKPRDVSTSKVYWSRRNCGCFHKLPDKSKVVAKKWMSADEETKKSLIKEARLLQNLRHANVVEFKGICTDQLSLLLEYAYFDFMPFGRDIETHSLAEFLAVCEQSSCDGINVAAKQQLF